MILMGYPEIILPIASKKSRNRINSSFVSPKTLQKSQTLLQGFFRFLRGGAHPKKKKPPSHKGTKARGTTQIPAITGTLMRNEHETGFPTALFRKPTPMGTSAASQAKGSFSSGFPESPLSGDGSLRTFHLHSHSNHNKFILTYQIGKSRNFQEKSCYSPFSRLRCSFMRRSTPFSVIA